MNTPAMTFETFLQFLSSKSLPAIFILVVGGFIWFGHRMDKIEHEDLKEMKTEMKELRSDLHTIKLEMVEMKGELKGDIATLKVELKGEIAELKTDIAEIKALLKEK